MKARWRILKYGLRYHSIAKCDQTWLTCCALYNMVLDKDGLVDSRNNDVGTYMDDEDSMIQVPFPIFKLLDPNLAQRYDTSGTQ